MKTVILAGGLPSSITDEAEGIPKPMAEIGGRPILWHIMKHFSAYGLKEFIICGGYKINLIKDYFNDFYCYQSDVTIDLRNNQLTLHNNISEDWKVTVVDTGLDSTTDTRIRQIKKYVENEDFLVVYGDCITDINVNTLIDTFYANNRVATLVVAKPAARNTILAIDENGIYCGKDIKVNAETYSAWANANVFAFQKNVFEYIEKEKNEVKPIIKCLAEEGQVATYIHRGFWMPVETMRDKAELEEIWDAHAESWKAR